MRMPGKNRTGKAQDPKKVGQTPGLGVQIVSRLAGSVRFPATEEVHEEKAAVA
jgi:hypothetical protein